MNLPEKIYSIRYNNRFLGFNERSKLPQSIVFAFHNRSHALTIRDKIRQLAVIPKLHLDENQHFVMSKRPYRRQDKEDIYDIDEVLVLEHKAKPFVIKLGINMIDTCLVHDITEIYKSIKFNSYNMISIREAQIEHIVANLDRIYDIESAEHTT
jgi:hypothetical protein